VNTVPCIIEAQPQPVRRRPDGDDRRDPRAGEHSADERPHACPRDGQRDRCNRPDNRVDRRQQPLPDEIHIAVEDPRSGLERGGGEGQRHDQSGEQQLVLAVHDYEDWHGEREDQRDADRRNELRGERLLERDLLVLVVLLQVPVRDAELTQPPDGQEPDDEHTPHAVVRPGEEPGDDEAAHQRERLQQDGEERIHQHATGDALSHKAGRPLLGHRPC
jgi:hypothetical protein